MYEENWSSDVSLIFWILLGVVLFLLTCCLIVCFLVHRSARRRKQMLQRLDNNPKTVSGRKLQICVTEKSTSLRPYQEDFTISRISKCPTRFNNYILSSEMLCKNDILPSNEKITNGSPPAYNDIFEEQDCNSPPAYKDIFKV